MQHRRRRWGRGIRFRGPSVEWKERDKNSKTNKQHQVNTALRVRPDLTEARGSRQGANIKAARRGGKALIKKDQAKQQNKTANCQVDGDLPRRRDTISAAPD